MLFEFYFVLYVGFNITLIENEFIILLLLIL